MDLGEDFPETEQRRSLFQLPFSFKWLVIPLAGYTCSNDEKALSRSSYSSKKMTKVGNIYRCFFIPIWILCCNFVCRVGYIGICFVSWSCFALVKFHFDRWKTVALWHSIADLTLKLLLSRARNLHYCQLSFRENATTRKLSLNLKESVNKSSSKISELLRSFFRFGSIHPAVSFV